MKKTRHLVRKRARNYWENQKRTRLSADANQLFFKNIKAYNSKEKPQNFNIHSIFQSQLSDKQISEKLADHFNGISCEFDGLDPSNIPVTYLSPPPPLTEEQVLSRLKRFGKPKSMVKYDIFPALVNDVAPFLAGPLTSIYNLMMRSSTWPM